MANSKYLHNSLDTQQEVWSWIPGYKNLYAVSNEGRVYSTRSCRCLNPKLSRAGYLRVNFAVGGVMRTFSVHRLVANAFVPNPDGKPTVNHLNEVKTDNRAENLEWATMREQNVYGTRIQRAVANTDWQKRSRKMDYQAIASKHDYFNMQKKQMKPVHQLDMHGSFIAQFPSLAAAARAVGASPGGICSCLKKQRRSADGFRWAYA